MIKTSGTKLSAATIFSHTGLRGIAAMYVLFYHLFGGEKGAVHPNAFTKLFQWGGYSVDLFFLLSGFILNWVYLSGPRPLDWRSYLMARVARILPLYYLTMLMFTPVMI